MLFTAFEEVSRFLVWTLLARNGEYGREGTRDDAVDQHVADSVKAEHTQCRATLATWDCVDDSCPPEPIGHHLRRLGSLAAWSLALLACTQPTNSSVRTSERNPQAEGSETPGDPVDSERPDPGADLDSARPLSDFVRRISQDHRGHLWFGTNSDGVARYDGHTLEYFSVDEGFGGMAVRGIVEDRESNVWFGTENGLTRYDGNAFFNFGRKDGLIGNTVRGCCGPAPWKE